MERAPCEYAEAGTVDAVKRYDNNSSSSSRSRSRSRRNEQLAVVVPKAMPLKAEQPQTRAEKKNSRGKWPGGMPATIPVCNNVVCVCELPGGGERRRWQKNKEHTAILNKTHLQPLQVVLSSPPFPSLLLFLSFPSFVSLLALTSRSMPGGG